MKKKIFICIIVIFVILILIIASVIVPIRTYKQWFHDGAKSEVDLRTVLVLDLLLVIMNIIITIYMVKE